VVRAGRALPVSRSDQPGAARRTALTESFEQIASASRWRSACTTLGLSGGEEERSRLLRGWSTSGRHYHTVEHLASCLLELDDACDFATAPAEVELALWFHDAIYRSWRNDNEARSAEWARQFLLKHGAASDIAFNVHRYVMATAHAAGALDGDAALVVDIDLSILGKPQPVYDAFERNVRKEYWWVPRRRFSAARSRVLRSFLARPSIYHWPSFRQRYEASARENLERAVQALEP
jgi:predicted metal-dependent HD superfamily phosphohydrolase